MKRKQKSISLKTSIMLLFLIMVVFTASAIGYNGILSIKQISSTSYQTYVTSVNEGYNTEIKSQIQSTLSVLQNEYNLYLSGKKTEEQAKEDAKEIIRCMRYRDDKSGYFWIDDTNYILIMHPILSENEGTNRMNLEDQNGVMIIQEIMKVCQSAEKGGYNEFYFTKADGVTVAPKIAYSEIFEPWGWVVSTGNYIDDIEANMEIVKADIQSTYDHLMSRVNLVFAIAVTISLVIAFFYGTYLIHPLKEIQSFADVLSSGDMTAEVSVKQKNEIGQTAASLQIAQKNMRELLQDITGVAQSVQDVINEFERTFSNMTHSINEVSVSVDTLSSNVTEQASSTDEATNEVDTMAQKIHSTDSEINALNQNTADMKQLSEQSMATLNSLLTVNTKTQTDLVEMHRQTETMNQSVQKIQIAANLINEISEQTSLLALNASIEAARAGEFGKGFAVVADEIGKLAQQSADSVEEIHEILDDLLSNSSRSMEIMREINESAHSQVNSLSETKDTFTELYKQLDDFVNSVQSIDNMTQEIEQQRVSVTQALTVLNQLAQNNATVTQETSGMSLELLRVVNESEEIVSTLNEKVKVLVANIKKFKI